MYGGCINAKLLFEILAEGEGDEFKKRHFQYAIESLARQTGDVKLFERIRLESQVTGGNCLADFQEMPDFEYTGKAA